MFKSRAYLENPDNEELQKAEKSRKFFYRFLHNHRKELAVPMQMHKEFGLKKNQVNRKEDWSNVSRHCVVEMAAADILAEKLNLSAEDRAILIQATFLHDFYKRKSVEMMNAAEDKTKADVQSQELSSAELVKNNIDPGVIALLDKSLGYDSLDYVLLGKASLIEQVMHYIDDITANVDLVNLQERIEVLKKRYPKINEEGKERWGKPTYDVQLEAGKIAESNIAARLGIKKSEDLPAYINGILADKINQEIL